MAQLNFFKSRPAYGWGPGVTQRRHIADIYGKNPIKFAQAAYLTWGANYGASMMSLLKEHTSIREFESDDEYTWDLYGNTWKNYPLLEARDMDGTHIDENYSTNVGIGGEPFQLVFGEQPFA